MRDLAVLVIHLIATLARLLGPGGLTNVRFGDGSIIGYSKPSLPSEVFFEPITWTVESKNGGFASFYNATGKRVALVGASLASDSKSFANPESDPFSKLPRLGIGSRKVSNSGLLIVADSSGKDTVVISGAGNGSISVNGKYVADYAEVFDLATHENVIPGTVMSVIEGGRTAPSAAPYDRKVVGVISGAGDVSPGIQLGARPDGSTDLPLAVMGQVYVRVCVENGPIQVGDLLVSSGRPGTAMRATDLTRAFGAVIGKALEPYQGDRAHQEGLVRMLVMTR